MDPVEAERVEKALHVVEQIADRPDVVGAGVGRLAVTTHVAAEHAVMSRERWYPVIPKAGTAAEAVLNPESFGMFPGVGEIIDVVMHLVVVGLDLRHRYFSSIIGLFVLVRSRHVCEFHSRNFNCKSS